MKNVGLTVGVVLIVGAVSTWLVPSCASKRSELVPQTDQPQ